MKIFQMIYLHHNQGLCKRHINGRRLRCGRHTRHSTTNHKQPMPYPLCPNPHWRFVINPKMSSEHGKDECNLMCIMHLMM